MLLNLQPVLLLNNQGVTTMSVDTFFQIALNHRIDFIDNKILAHFPENDRPAARERAIDVVNRYEGRDADALSILKYAAERGRFEEFAGKMEAYCAKELGFVHPEARRVAGVPGAHKAEEFLISCYKDLGIESRTKQS